MTYGKTYDNFGIGHDVKLCRPVPTNSWNHDVVPGMTDCGIFERDIKDFQYNDEPSGGSSNRISPGEMFLAYIRIENYPGSGWIKFTWGRLPENTTMFQITVPVPAKKDSSWTHWYWEAYGFIGHFPNELDHAGDFFVNISSSWGTVRYDFHVSDIRADKARETDQDSAIANMQAQIFTQQARIQELEGLLAKNALQDEKDREDSAAGIAGIWAGLEAWLVERILGILLKGLDREVKGMK